MSATIREYLSLFKYFSLYKSMMLKSGLFLFFAFLFLVEAKSSEKSEASSSEQSSEHKTVNVHYHIWVGDNVDDSYSKNVKVPACSKFFDVMTKAAEDDVRFEFTFITYSFGRFISSIGGVSQTSSQFWLIYVLPSHPNVNNRPGSDKLSNVGVDDLEVEDGKHYLFWLTSGSH